MYIDTNKMISITDANRNFSNLTKMVDREKQIVIMKNNKPKYAMMVYDESDTVQKETMLINDEKSDYGSSVINDRVENVSEDGTVRLPDSIIRKLNIDKTGTVTFIEEKNRVRVENTSKYALKKFQMEMEGKAKEAGLESPEDVQNLIKEIRRELWEQFYADND